MKNNTPKTPKKRALKNPDVFKEFVFWISTFELAREPKTQVEFAKKFGVSIDTLTDWKKRDDFWENVQAEWRKWGREKTTNVVQKLYNTIIKEGRTSDIKLWLEYFHNWVERQDHSIQLDGVKELTETFKELMQNNNDDNRSGKANS